MERVYRKLEAAPGWKGNRKEIDMKERNEKKQERKNKENGQSKANQIRRRVGKEIER